MTDPRPDRATGAPEAPATSAAPVRVLLGGFLMGFANLVPGISGGTMILAVGLYDRFVRTLADLTRLRLTRANLLFCAWLGIGLVTAVLTLSDLLVDLVVHQRWAMYSLFVGMTLGGVPALLRSCRPFTPALAGVTALGLAAMALFAFRLRDVALPDHPAVLVAVGAVCAMSMILPGISGSYLLLVFGLYETVVGSLSSRALRSDPAGSLWILVPVGLGAVLGIAALSRSLEKVLERFPRTTHAALLGLLLGSVLGLYPFQRPVHPELADRATRKAVQAVLEGSTPELALERSGAELDVPALEALVARQGDAGVGELKRRGEALERFSPGTGQVAGSAGLLLAGVLITLAFGRRPRGARPATD